jgi:ATP-dependent DNA helicase RecG
MKYGKAYGGKHPVLEEGDIFRTTVYCPDFEGKTSVLRSQPESGVQSGVQSVTDRVLKVLEAGPAGKNEIALALGYSKRTRHLNELMAKLLDEGVVEYTVPDKPNSRLQKYRLKAV